MINTLVNNDDVRNFENNAKNNNHSLCFQRYSIRPFENLDHVYCYANVVCQVRITE